MSVVVKARKKPPMRRGGYYWILDQGGGKPQPLVSVTEVLNEVAKQAFFVPAAIRKAHAAWSENPEMDVREAQGTWYKNMRARADIGSMLHSFYEAYGRGTPLDPDSLPDEPSRNHARAFLKWFDAVGPELLQVESTVANPLVGYAGTGDLWCKIGGMIAIIDYKTGFLDEFSCAMQESAYREGTFGIDKVTGDRFDLPKAEAMYALQTRDDGTYLFVELPDRFNDFKAYLHVWRARNNVTCPEACWCGGETRQ